MPVHDATAGFRAYRADALRTMGLDQVASQGYCFQVDLTQRAVRPGLRVVEVPDHLRRARDRRLQDERRHHARVAAADHPLGAGAPRRPAAGSDAPGADMAPRCRAAALRAGAAVRAGWRWSSCSCSSSRSWRSPPSSRWARSSAAGRPWSCCCWSRCSAPGWCGARAPAPGPRSRRPSTPGGCRAVSSPTRPWCWSAGTLLLTPGFLTDIVGFFFILPMTRPLARRCPRGRGRQAAARGHVRPGREGAAARGSGPGHHRGRGPLTSSDAAARDLLRTAGTTQRPRHTGMTEGRVPIGDAAFRS